MGAGGESVIPGLKAMVDIGSELGIENYIFGMAHRCEEEEEEEKGGGGGGGGGERGGLSRSLTRKNHGYGAVRCGGVLFFVGVWCPGARGLLMTVVHGVVDVGVGVRCRFPCVTYHVHS